jgi:hypothetical protein
MNHFIETITSVSPEIRNRPFQALCKNLSAQELIKYLMELDNFRKSTQNLYERVRACIFFMRDTVFI